MIFHRALPFLLITTGLFYICVYLFINNKTLFQPYNAQLYQQKYENSQWNSSTNLSPIRILDLWALNHGINGWGIFSINNKEKINVDSFKQYLLEKGNSNKISDQELYTYAGYKYMHGQDPTLLNAEAPPFGKYIIGASISLFQNGSVLPILIGLLCLPLIFGITFELSKSIIAASLAVFLTSIHTLFIDQIINVPQLDVLQLFFFLIFLYGLLWYEKKPNYLLLLGIGAVFGLFLSIKITFFSFVLINAWLVLFYLLKKEKYLNSLKNLLILNVSGILIYILTYINYFLLGGTLKGFLSVQKYVFNFYLSSHIDTMKIIGSYLSLIFFNKWRFWSGGYPVIQYEYWNVLWPIIFITGILAGAGIIRFRTKFDKRFILLILFLGVYSIFLFVIPIFPRYLLLLYVPIHILISIFSTKMNLLWKK